MQDDAVGSGVLERAKHLTMMRVQAGSPRRDAYPPSHHDELL